MSQATKTRLPVIPQLARPNKEEKPDERKRGALSWLFDKDKKGAPLFRFLGGRSGGSVFSRILGAGEGQGLRGLLRALAGRLPGGARAAGAGLGRSWGSGLLGRLLASPGLRCALAALILAAMARAASELGSRWAQAPASRGPSLDMPAGARSGAARDAEERLAVSAAGLLRVENSAPPVVLAPAAPQAAPAKDRVIAEPARRRAELVRAPVRSPRLRDNLVSARTAATGATGASQTAPAKRSPKIQAGGLSAFTNAPEAATGGRLARAVLRGGESLELGRAAGRSKAMAQLRGMTHYNGAMRASAGPALAEAKSAAALAQFEGASPDAAPPAMLDGETPGSPAGGSNAGAAPSAADPDPASPGDASVACSQEQLNAGWVSNGSSCVERPRADGGNVTPWQPIVDLTLGAILAASALLALGALLVYLSVVLSDDEPELAAYLYYFAVAACASAATIGMGLIVSGGLTIGMGGVPEGLLIAGAGASIVAGAALTLVVEGADYVPLLTGGIAAVAGFVAGILGVDLKASRAASKREGAEVAAVRG